MKEVGGRGVVFILSGLIGGLLGVLARASTAWAGYTSPPDDPFIGPDKVSYVFIVLGLGWIFGAGLAACTARFVMTLPTGRRLMMYCAAWGAAVGMAVTLALVASILWRDGWQANSLRMFLEAGGIMVFLTTWGALTWGDFLAAGAERRAGRAAYLTGPAAPASDGVRRRGDGVEGADA